MAKGTVGVRRVRESGSEVAVQRPVGRGFRRAARPLAVDAVPVGEAGGICAEGPAAATAHGSAVDHGGSARLHSGATCDRRAR